MRVDVSLGELVDKITILQIKLERFNDPAKLANVKKEHGLLTQELASSGFTTDSPYFAQLLSVNQQLWEIEDRLRIKEVHSEFDAEFIELARSVYFRNDERSEIKRAINLEFKSELVEEKQYCKYR